jgi:hypothetical protein
MLNGMKERGVVSLGLALVFVVGGCGASSTEPNSRCDPLPQVAVEQIESTFSRGQALRFAVSVKSKDLDHEYFVSGQVLGDPALWVTNKLDGTGKLYSVNDLAYQVSGKRRSEDLAPPITKKDDGASEALYCAKPT